MYHRFAACSTLAVLTISALLPLTSVQAQTATYSLNYSCTGLQPTTVRDLPLRDFGGTDCFNIIHNTAVAKRSVAWDFQSSAGYFGGRFGANYISDSWHGGGQAASLHLDDFVFSDSFTVQYDNPSLAGPVNLTLMVAGDLLTLGYGSGYSSNGTMLLTARGSNASGRPGPSRILGSRGFSNQFTDSLSGSRESTDLAPLILSVENGSLITLSLFADVFVRGSLGQGINGTYPDESGADVRGYLTWWIEAPTGVRLVSASGHDYTQRVLAVPEPSSIALLLAGVGVVGVAGLRARRRARAQA